VQNVPESLLLWPDQVSTPPKLRVPKAQLPHLVTLSRMDAASFKQLAAALANAPLKFRTAELAKAVAATATADSAKQTRLIVHVLRELALVRALHEVDREEFAHDVVEGVVSRQEDFTTADRDRLSRRLAELIGLPSIDAPAKAHSLLVDHANYMCRARIFTDVRPVFGSDVDQTPMTAMVVHTLKVSFHQGSSVRDFFVVLDGGDLELLSDLIERAKGKEKTLHATIAAAGVEPLTTW
jgi:hypothetical protein